MRMHQLMVAAVVVASVGIHGARATIVVDFTVEPGGLYNPLVNPAQVPEAGARREITVRMWNTNAVVDGFGGFQTDLQASATGAVAVRPIGGAGSNGRGSRYNTPDWDGTLPFDPAPPSGPIPVFPGSCGLYSTVIVNGNPNAASHIVGWIVVDFLPRPVGSEIVIRSVNFQAFGLFGDNLDAAYGSPATFAYVPEPAVGVLMLGTGGCFLRGRRQRA